MAKKKQTPNEQTEAQTELDYIVTPIKNLKPLSPEEEKEARRLAALSINVHLITGSRPEYDTTMTEEERLAISEREANLILNAARLGERYKDQELATEKEQIATNRRQLQDAAENTIKDLAADNGGGKVETDKPRPLSIMEIAEQLMIQNPKITGPTELISKVNKALKRQGKETTYKYIKNKVWPVVKAKK